MTDPHDVSLHFFELKKQLLDDGFDSSTPIGSLLTRLSASLLQDGFDIDVAVTEEPPIPSTEYISMPTTSSPVIEEPKPVTTSVAKCFRMFSKSEAEFAKSFFISQGSVSVTLTHKDKFFVFVSRQEITDFDVKFGLKAYVARSKEA